MRVLRGREQAVAGVASALGRGQVVVITGPAGIGKTALARHAMQSADVDDVLHLVGLADLQMHPLGSLAGVVPQPRPDDPFPQSFAFVVEALAARDLILVDDADQLDKMTALALERVVQHRDTRLLLTIRTGRVLPDPLERLRASQDGTTYTLGRLTPSSVASMARDLIDAIPSSKLLSRLESLAAGNPLHVRELILGGLESGALDVSDGVAEVRGRLDESERISLLIASRIQLLDAELRSALECCILAGALPRAVLDRIEVGAADELLDRQLLGTEPGRPAWAMPAHPLIATWRRRLDYDTQRRHYATLASVDSDQTRRVLWLARSGEAVGTKTGIHAASRLRWSHGRAAALDVLSQCPPSEVVELARARVDLGGPRSAEAMRVVWSLTESADQQVRVAAALAYSTSIVHVIGDVDHAREVLADVAATVQQQRLRAPLDARRAALTIMHRWAEDDLAAARRVLEAPDVEPDVVFDAASGASAMFSASGDLVSAAEAERRAWETIDRTVHTPGWAAFTFIGPAAWRRLLQGQTHEAIALTTQLFDATSNEDVLARSGIGGVLAWMHLIGGDIVAAFNVAAETWRASAPSDAFNFAEPDRHLAIWFAAMLDDESALVDLGEIDQHDQPSVAIFDVMRAAAIDALRIRNAEPAEALAAVEVEPGIGAWFQRVCAAWTLFPEGHECVDETIKQIANHWPNESQSLFPHLVEEYQARQRADADALLGCARRHARAGRWLWSATAARHARDASARTPSTALAAEDALRSAREQLPELARPWQPGTEKVLTPRQWEIVDGIRDGQSSRQIADALVVSPRTIDTHLQRIFATTGMHSRQQIAAALLPE